MRRFGRLAPAAIAAVIGLGLGACGGDDGADVRNLDEEAGTGTGSGTDAEHGTGTEAEHGTGTEADDDTGTGADS